MPPPPLPPRPVGPSTKEQSRQQQMLWAGTLALAVAMGVVAIVVAVANGRNGGPPGDQPASQDTVSRADFEALKAKFDTLTHQLDDMVVVKDDGTKGVLDDTGHGVKGYVLVGDTMIQWGVSRTTPPNYAVQKFAPAFQAPPTVTGSFDRGATGPNDGYCNIVTVSNGFQFIGVKQEASKPDRFVLEAADFHWIAIGQRKK